MIGRRTPVACQMCSKEIKTEHRWVITIMINRTTKEVREKRVCDACKEQIVKLGMHLRAV